jgi:hypothetical protein
MLFAWLEEHQTGILTTIAVHLLIITAVLILKINTYTEREYSIMIDLSQISMETGEQPAPPPEANAQEMAQRLQQEYNIRHIPVNMANEQAVENIDRMVRDIKTEMNIKDPPPLQDQAEDILPGENQPPENEARIYDDKYPVGNSGERTVYKGATTVSYELGNRRHMFIPVPAYKCQGHGKVVVNITVNRRGYVLKAEIDKNDKTDSQDPCLIETAVRDAERSRFNESATAKEPQQGSITYIFFAQ